MAWNNEWALRGPPRCGIQPNTCLENLLIWLLFLHDDQKDVFITKYMQILKINLLI